MGRMHQEIAVLELARLIHWAGRAPVAAGQTLAHAVDPAKVRPFVPWEELPPHVIAGRVITAAQVMALYEVEMVGVQTAYYFGFGQLDAFDGAVVESLAEALHGAERKAVELGLVLVKLDRPWVEFKDLPEQAQAGRRRQAVYLLQRVKFVRRS
jgi:hypothetical protein